jgi:2-dehydro-3-deoxyphosphogluconate aldolase/(4S)-4-hydroxy-2-oxoglutarate aldolase
MAAVAAGANVVKLFPASLGGPGYLAALRGPFPEVRFVSTGGIAVSDVPTWLAAGAVCVGLGSSLAGGSAPRTRADLDRITAEARRAVELAGGGS